MTVARPSVSVVIPARNGSATILATIDSVLRQTYRGEVDITVVDDGSTDGTAELVEGEHPTVQVIRQAPLGLPTARNAGAADAVGDWLAFLDSDDLWHEEHLARLFRRLAEHPEARVISSATTRFSTVPLPDPSIAPVLPIDGPPRAASIPPVVIPEPADALVGRPATIPGQDEPWWLHHHDVLVGNSIMSSNGIIERRTFRCSGGFPLALPAAEDYGFWLAVTRLAPILMTPDRTFFYRMTPTSMTYRKNLGLAHAAALTSYVLGVDLDEDDLAVTAALRRHPIGRDVLWLAHRSGLDRGRPVESNSALALARVLMPSRTERLRFAAGARRAEIRSRWRTSPATKRLKRALAVR